ncbi:MAG TPA: ChbG/HpnK family deacetylase, partial [Albitalea sp.]|nr:ChbG/HpnK family deacetylase [Albitalea sp.]
SLAVCADDFGLSPGVSAGIARLAQARRLTAVSCLTNGPHWRAASALLPATVDAGLHFNLSDGVPLSPELRALWPRFPSLPRLIALAHLHALPGAAIAAELAAQWAAFSDASGRAPAFVDGHQHVHHLPQVRDALLAAVEAATPRPVVRSAAHVLGPGFAFKRAVIAGTGARTLQRELVRRGIAHNAHLIGVYDFRGDYRAQMQRWLAQVPPEGALLFCHPGDADASGVADPIAAARPREAAYFASDAFAADLADAGVSISETSTRG